MGTPPLNKNGRDHAQDRALRDMDAKNAKEHSAFRAANDKAHSELFAFLQEMRNDEKWKRRIFTVGWSILMAVVAGMVVWLQSNETRLDQADTMIHSVQSEERANAREGFQMAKEMRNDIDRNEDSIRELQRLHRINPDERRRANPAEEK